MLGGVGRRFTVWKEIDLESLGRTGVGAEDLGKKKNRRGGRGSGIHFIIDK